MVLSYLTTEDAALLQQPISTSIGYIKFEGKVNYEVEFSNSQRVKNTYYWNHQVEIEKTQGENYLATIKGEIVGFGHILRGKYEKALAAYNQINTQQDANLYYTGNGTLKLVNTSTTFQQIDGKISYSAKYSDSDSVLALTDIRKETITVSRDANRHLTTYFNIINNKEIAQLQRNLLPNSISYSIKMTGRADTSISAYLNKAKSYIQNADYISDANYSYNPADRAFTLNVSVVSLPAS
jgi:tetratricopeptide (TPR) repeat protein